MPSLQFYHDTQLVKRLKSFLWRGGMMGLAFTLEWMTSNVGLLELSPMATTVAGLMLGEVSKYINQNASTI
jgi:hypothetical protein